MKEKTQDRQSNFELMRIVSMFLVVLNHFIMHGLVWYHTYGVSKMFFDVLLIITRVNVPSFILLTGYFQYKKSMKMNNAIKVNNAMWFYSVAIMFAFIIFFKVKVANITILQTLIPIDFGQYWFTNMYLILYLTTPIWNLVIANCNKDKHKKIIILLFILFSILTYFTHDLFYNASGGLSLFSFILFYFIGAYLGKYPVDKNKTIEQKRIKFFSISVLCIILNCLLYMFGNTLLTSNRGILIDFGSIFVNNFYSFLNPLIVIQSICYLLFFSTIEIKFKLLRKIINRIAACVFGVYLFSENIFLVNSMYSFLGFTDKNYSVKITFYMLLCSLCVFTIGIIIEIFRQVFFKFIYNRKWAEKFRNWYQIKVKMLGFKVNW
jgi:surface polysaccharide O-acyltransferase-like enzyme